MISALEVWALAGQGGAPSLYQDAARLTAAAATGRLRFRRRSAPTTIMARPSLSRHRAIDGRSTSTSSTCRRSKSRAARCRASRQRRTRSCVSPCCFPLLRRDAPRRLLRAQPLRPALRLRGARRAGSALMRRWTQAPALWRASRDTVMHPYLTSRLTPDAGTRRSWRSRPPPTST